MLDHNKDIRTKIVYATTNYDQFTIQRGNREIDPLKISRMMACIQGVGNFLPDFPIAVTEDGVVRDGQHRLRAAQGMGLPVHYIITDMGVLDVAETARNTDKWRLVDYLHFFAEEGFDNYISLRDFHKENSDCLSLTTCISAGGSYSRSGSIHHMGFKRGGYVFSRKDVLEDAAPLLRELATLLPPALVRLQGFQFAVIRLVSRADFDKDRLLSQIRDKALTVRRQPDVNTYVKALEDVYNFGFSKNRVKFSQ